MNNSMENSLFPSLSPEKWNTGIALTMFLQIIFKIMYKLYYLNFNYSDFQFNDFVVFGFLSKLHTPEILHRFTPSIL